VLTSLRDLYESIRPVRATDPTVNPDVTLVTAYVEIDDIPSDTEASFARRNRAKYLDWMRSALSIRQNLVIFVEESTRDFVTALRSELAAHTVVKTVDVEALRQSTWYRETKRIIDGGYMQHATRPRRVELRAPLYNTIMFFKAEWVRQAIEADPFGTRYFLWMDAGIGHGLDRRLRYRSVINRVWPSATKNHRMEDTILVLGTGLHQRHMSASELITRHCHVVAGTIWGGDRNRLLVFVERFQEELSWALAHNLLDDDQSIMSAVYLKYPELFTAVDCSSPLRDRCYFLKYLDASGG
jgi:hypothetical protein